MNDVKRVALIIANNNKNNSLNDAERVKQFLPWPTIKMKFSTLTEMS